MSEDLWGPPQGGSVVSPATGPVVLGVSELLREARTLLEGTFPRLWVEGEISNFSRPRSGHWYFTLKDEQAQLRCAMFRSDNRRLDFTPEDGMQVMVRGRLTLYEARGDFQLVAEHLEEAGDGALRRTFEALKRRLMAEGLFDEDRKRPLPTLPRRIGVLTSPTGAALHDILNVLRHRFPAIPVRLYPIPVQGIGAAEEIARMLELAGRRGDCDVLILARGGGSLEDLWAFNEEIVARAIIACPVPIVTGIGHQVDFTIADFCADLRAPTPSAAAERVVPDVREWLTRLDRLESRLQQTIRRRLSDESGRLRHLNARLRHPRELLRQRQQRCDDLEQRLLVAMNHALRRHHHHFHALRQRLQTLTPRREIDAAHLRLANLSTRLIQNQRQRLQAQHERLQALARTLDAVSPLATLGRGFAIIEATDGGVIRSVEQTRPGQDIRARLQDGRLHCRIEHIDDTQGSS